MSLRSSLLCSSWKFLNSAWSWDDRESWNVHGQKHASAISSNSLHLLFARDANCHDAIDIVAAELQSQARAVSAPDRKDSGTSGLAVHRWVCRVRHQPGCWQVFPQAMQSRSMWNTTVTHWSLPATVRQFRFHSETWIFLAETRIVIPVHSKNHWWWCDDEDLLHKLRESQQLQGCVSLTQVARLSST